MNGSYRPFQATLTPPGLGQLGLSLEIRQPAAVLAGVVFSYLQIKATRPTPYPIVPDGTQALYLSQEGTLLGGALTVSTEIALLQPGEYFGLWFYPGALRHFYRLDLSEISNQFVDAAEFACSELSRLHDEVYRQKGFSDRSAECEKFLLRRYRNTPLDRFGHALSLTYGDFGRTRVDQIANEVGWSSRHLNRQFLLHTGLTTKTFSSVIRAQHVLKKLYCDPRTSMSAQIGMSYYDQAHFIKEFRKLYRSTPGQLAAKYMSDIYNR